MTVNTLMAIYTACFGLQIVTELATKYVPEQNYVMSIFGAVALYGIVETLVKYYYVRKEVMAEIQANADKDGNNVNRK